MVKGYSYTDNRGTHFARGASSLAECIDMCARTQNRGGVQEDLDFDRTRACLCLNEPSGQKQNIEQRICKTALQDRLGKALALIQTLRPHRNVIAHEDNPQPRSRHK